MTADMRTEPGAASDVSTVRETTLIRERSTAASATALLSEPGRSERDRLLLAAAACILVCLPGKFEKLALGPLEFSAISATALRVGAVASVFYFAITFATQALMDLARWRATFLLGVLELMPRLDLHNEVLGQRTRSAEEQRIRFLARLEAHRAEVDPLSAELVSITGASEPDHRRTEELGAEIQAARDRFAAENASDEPAYSQSADYEAVLGMAKRVGQLRLLMWINVIATISLPLVIAALSIGPALWLLSHG